MLSASTRTVPKQNRASMTDTASFRVRWESIEAATMLATLRLGSAALPIGSFAYSQGLEQAVANREVHNLNSASRWVVGLLENSVLSGDVPVLQRLCRAWQAEKQTEVAFWNDWLFATRATRELREEERQLGSALFRLLVRQGHDQALPFQSHPRATLASAFALSATLWRVPPPLSAMAYCFAWVEAQVGAATRLIPLGQSQAQELLSGALRSIATQIPVALERSDRAISHTAPGQAILSGAHETQYSRLFRS